MKHLEEDNRKLKTQNKELEIQLQKFTLQNKDKASELAGRFKDGPLKPSDSLAPGGEGELKTA